MYNLKLYYLIHISNNTYTSVNIYIFFKVPVHLRVK